MSLHLRLSPAASSPSAVHAISALHCRLCPFVFSLCSASSLPSSLFFVSSLPFVSSLCRSSSLLPVRSPTARPLLLLLAFLKWQSPRLTGKTRRTLPAGKAYDGNPYDESSNQSGVIQMGLAKNQLGLMYQRGELWHQKDSRFGYCWIYEGNIVSSKANKAVSSSGRQFQVVFLVLAVRTGFREHY